MEALGSGPAAKDGRPAEVKMSGVLHVDKVMMKRGMLEEKLRKILMLLLSELTPPPMCLYEWGAQVQERFVLIISKLLSYFKQCLQYIFFMHI